MRHIEDNILSKPVAPNVKNDLTLARAVYKVRGDILNTSSREKEKPDIADDCGNCIKISDEYTAYRKDINDMFPKIVWIWRGWLDYIITARDRVDISSSPTRLTHFAAASEGPKVEDFGKKAMESVAMWNVLESVHTEWSSCDMFASKKT